MQKQGFRAIISIAAVLLASATWCRAGDAVQLQLKLEKGKTYYQRMVTEFKSTSTTTMKILGEQQPEQKSVTEEGEGTGMKLEVLDVDAQGNM